MRFAPPVPTTAPRVLVADDNPVSRELASRMLEQFGCRAVTAVDGLDALDVHRARHCQLILMDCQMPRLDGFEATRRLRDEERRDAAPRTQVVALTAEAGAASQARCLAAGMDGVLAKPLRPRTIGETLTRFLGLSVDAMVAAPPDDIDAVSAAFGPDFTTLATLFLQDGPARLAGLQDALARADLAAMARLAHAFAGSSVSIGASGLAVLCRELELAAARWRRDDCIAQLAAVEVEYQDVSTRLRALARDG